MIDRRGVVERFSPANKGFDVFSPLSVGNGEFAFTCDATGLQTFNAEYDSAIPLCTMSQWGWHSAPYSADEPAFPRERLTPRMCDNGERDVPYYINWGDDRDGFNWLRENPHRFSLARVGFAFPGGGRISQINSVDQRLELYSGIIKSSFDYAGEAVRVETCVHPTRDILAVRVNSALLSSGLGIEIEFPAPSPDRAGADFNKPDTHTTVFRSKGGGSADIIRHIDRDVYFVALGLSGGGGYAVSAPHKITVTSNTSSILELVAEFSPAQLRGRLPSFDECAAENAAFWQGYWEKGGFVSIENGGAQGDEIQRRIILSQYLTAIQCAGSLPPAETGLTMNSWYGKYHLEMHWWHSAHFPLWGRSEFLERSMWYYNAILPAATALAKEQGYEGARWPKMTERSGMDSPSPIGSVLIWQQPHPIYYCELLYRANQDEAVLRRYAQIVEESARFMASYMRYDSQNGRYVLGPGLIPAQENHRMHDVLNPTFELEYWVWGLETANMWRERLGLAKNEKWSDMAARIARPTINDGLYMAHENCPGTFAPPFNRDHPSMLCALGVMPGTLIDPSVMEKTYRAVLDGRWQIDEEVWGWDFPVIAMCAARLGLREEAPLALIYPSKKNEYLNNGHNKQSDRSSLPLYLPGNGGLLTAVAMMCAGWDGCGEALPGFPKEWNVRFENLAKMP